MVAALDLEPRHAGVLGVVASANHPQDTCKTGWWHGTGGGRLAPEGDHHTGVVPGVAVTLEEERDIKQWRAPLRVLLAA